MIGFLHPMIHLGFGVEFQQPAIIAEALGQAAIHSAWQDAFFLAVDEEAKQNRHPSRSLVNILNSIRADKKLSSAAHWEDDNKVRDGILVRAKDEMVKYASQWRVESDKLEEAVAEMTNAASKSRTNCMWMSLVCSSLLYRRCPTSSETDQVRFLLHACCQCLYLLLILHQAIVDQYREQGQAP